MVTLPLPFINQLNCLVAANSRSQLAARVNEALGKKDCVSFKLLDRLVVETAARCILWMTYKNKTMIQQLKAKQNYGLTIESKKNFDLIGSKIWWSWGSWRTTILGRQQETRKRKYNAVVAKMNKKEREASSRTFRDGWMSTLLTQVTKTIANAI